MNAIDRNDGASSSIPVLGYVNLTHGRRLSYTDWGDPAGRPVLEFRGLPNALSGDAIDMGVLARRQEATWAVVGVVDTRRL